MTVLADVRRGIAYAVTEGTKTANRPEGVHCDAYLRDGSIFDPYAEVVRLEMDPRMVFSGAKNQYQLRLRFYWSITNELAAQEEMDELCDPGGESGIVAAIENDELWPSDVTVDYAQVTLVGEQVVVDRAGVPYFMVPFDIEVVW